MHRILLGLLRITSTFLMLNWTFLDQMLWNRPFALGSIFRYLHIQRYAWILGTVMSICTLHILRYIDGSPVKRHFCRKMNISQCHSRSHEFPISSSFVAYSRRNCRKCVILGSAVEWQNSCEYFFRCQKFIKLT